MDFISDISQADSGRMPACVCEFLSPGFTSQHHTHESYFFVESHLIWELNSQRKIGASSSASSWVICMQI